MAEPSHIAITCANCGKQLRAPGSAVGKTGKCNACGTKFVISAAAPISPEEKAAQSPNSNVASRTASPASSLSQKPVSSKPASSKPASSTTKASSPTARTSGAPAKNADGLGRPSDGDDAWGDFGAPDLSDPGIASAIDQLISHGQQQVVKKVAATLSREEVVAAFKGSVPKRPVSFGYRLHLMLVAVAMALLPVMYIAFVAVVAFALVFYTGFIMPSLVTHVPRGRAAVVFLGLIIAPVIAGATMVLFLIKPLFFRIRDERRRRSLTRSAQPVLFELVDRICEATGAPVPQRIDVDYQVNASAQPLGGIWSVATGKMVLTIGIPLIAGMSARQLAGVLAHEFGHFSQKIGMGASLIIRKVNFWFLRVVYQRDTLDHVLDQLIDDSESWFVLVLQLAKVCVVFSRGVLWCFMMLGNFISAGLMRQMEYDADRYEYGLVGSKTFAETAFELQLLGASQQAGLDLMLEFFQRGRLADDMIYLTKNLRQQFPGELQAKIKSTWEAEKASWFATHPSDAARIARALAAEQPGCFQLDRPARDLVRYYDEICKGVTWDFYKDQLGSHISPQQLTPTTQLMET